MAASEKNQDNKQIREFVNFLVFRRLVTVTRSQCEEGYIEEAIIKKRSKK